MIHLHTALTLVTEEVEALRIRLRLNSLERQTLYRTLSETRARRDELASLIKAGRTLGSLEVANERVSA